MHQRQLVAQPQGQSTFPHSIAQESLCTAYCSACSFPLSLIDPACRNCGQLTAPAVAGMGQRRSLAFWTLALAVPALLVLSALNRIEQQAVHAATATMVAEGGR